MKKSFLFLAFLATSLLVSAQNSESTVQEGDILILAAVDGDRYHHINFPRKNIIMKRGAMANYDALVGKKLVVASIDANNTAKAVLKRKDGKPFFRFFPKVTANVEKAIKSGELKHPDSKTPQSLAK